MSQSKKIKNNHHTVSVTEDQKESGRSMVEMLGVLAIIGVISIGGIAGYTYAMDRYRTNELLDGGYKRAYTISTQLSAGVNPDLSEFSGFNETGGGNFGNTVQQWGEEFGITVTDVDKKVCENLIRTISDTTPLLAITTTANAQTVLESGNCGEGKNELYMVYNRDLIGRRHLTHGILGGIAGGSGSSGASPSASSSGGDVGLSTYSEPEVSSPSTYSQPEVSGPEYTAIMDAISGDYCTTHECTKTCGRNNIPCAPIDGRFFYYPGYTDPINAVTVCGGEQNIFEPAELGCTVEGQRCPYAPATGEYWLKGRNASGAFQAAVVNGVFRYGDPYTDSMSSYYGALCK